MSRAGIFASAVVVDDGPVVIGTYEEEVLADSPFFYFPMGEAAAPPVDQMGAVSPSGYAGLVFGAAGVGDRATAVDINGASGSNGLRVPAPSTPSAMTIEVLAKMDVWVSADEIARWTNVFSLRHNGTNNGLTAYFGGTTSGFIVGGYIPPAEEATAVHHYALTWNGTTARLYVDGVERSSSAKAIGAPGATLVVGGSPDATNRNMDGRFGGVAYYPTALSATRIMTHAIAAGLA